MSTLKVVVALVLIGLISGTVSGQESEPPECVQEWMDTSQEWKDFQISVEDSLEAVKVRERLLMGQLELAEDRLRWMEEEKPSWLEQWALPVAMTVGVLVGAVVTK